MEGFFKFVLRIIIVTVITTIIVWNTKGITSGETTIIAMVMYYYLELKDTLAEIKKNK